MCICELLEDHIGYWRPLSMGSNWFINTGASTWSDVFVNWELTLIHYGPKMVHFWQSHLRKKEGGVFGPQCIMHKISCFLCFTCLSPKFPLFIERVRCYMLVLQSILRHCILRVPSLSSTTPSSKLATACASDSALVINNADVISGSIVLYCICSG